MTIDYVQECKIALTQGKNIILVHDEIVSLTQKNSVTIDLKQVAAACTHFDRALIAMNGKASNPSYLTKRIQAYLVSPLAIPYYRPKVFSQKCFHEADLRELQ